MLIYKAILIRNDQPHDQKNTHDTNDTRDTEGAPWQDLALYYQHVPGLSWGPQQTTHIKHAICSCAKRTSTV